MADDQVQAPDLPAVNPLPPNSAPQKQDLPLLAIAPTSGWGRASEDIGTMLAQRALAQRQNLLDNLKLQMAVQAANDTSGVKQSEAGKNTAEAGKFGADAKLAGAQAGETTARTTGLNDQHQQIVARGHALDDLDAVLNDPNATADQRVAAMTKVKATGGQVPTDSEVKGAAFSQSQLDDLTKQYSAAVLQYGSDAPQTKAIGIQIMNHGGQEPREAAPKFTGVEGGILNVHTGAFTKNPDYVAPGGHKNDPELPDEFKAFLNTLPATINPQTGKPYSLEEAMAKVQRGVQGAGGGPGGLSLMQKYPQLDLAKTGNYLRQAYGNPMTAAFASGTAPEPTDQTPASMVSGAAPPTATPTPAATPAATANAPLKTGVIKLPGGPYEVNLNPDGTYTGAHNDVWKLEGGQWTRIK